MARGAPVDVDRLTDPTVAVKDCAR
jgi:hypothetical protein